MTTFEQAIAGCGGSNSRGHKWKTFKLDIFPRYFSTHVSPVEYPKRFNKLPGNEKKLKCFILFMDNGDKIYYKLRKITDNLTTHITFLGKNTKFFDGEFNPNRVNWSNVARKYRSPTEDDHRNNVDTRVGFKLDDKYIVKAFFTFGLRTVEPGSAHVYQTTEVPMLFFLNEKNKLRSDKSLFPYDNILKYDRRILVPNKCFRIPPGTNYMIFTLKKCFFSLNIVPENFDLEIPFEDPVVTKITKMINPYDVPCQTPYIEEIIEEEQTYIPPINTTTTSTTTNYYNNNSESENHHFDEIFTTNDNVASTATTSMQPQYNMVMLENGECIIIPEKQLFKQPLLPYYTEEVISEEPSCIENPLDSCIEKPLDSYIEKMHEGTQTMVVQKFEKETQTTFSFQNIEEMETTGTIKEKEKISYESISDDEEPLNLSTKLPAIDLDDLLSMPVLGEQDYQDLLNDICSPFAT